MLDVHVLVMEYTPGEWVEQCRASIVLAAKNAGFPVAVHFLPGIVGHLGRAREAGYARGSHPYVTHVDDDDYLTADAFAVLGENIEAGAECITTGETALFVETGRTEPCPNAKHHLAVFRRDLLSSVPLGDFAYYPDQYALSRFTSAHVAECVYVHRISKGSGSRKQRQINAGPAKAELDSIMRPELFTAEGLTYEQIASQYDVILGERQ